MIVPLKGVEKNHSLQGTIVHRTAVLLVKKQKKSDGVLQVGNKKVRQKKLNKEDSTPLPSLYKNIL